MNKASSRSFYRVLFCIFQEMYAFCLESFCKKETATWKLLYFCDSAISIRCFWKSRTCNYFDIMKGYYRLIVFIMVMKSFKNINIKLIVNTIRVLHNSKDISVNIKSAILLIWLYLTFINMETSVSRLESTSLVEGGQNQNPNFLEI